MWNCVKIKKMVNYGFLRKHIFLKNVKIAILKRHNSVILASILMRFFKIKFWKIIFFRNLCRLSPSFATVALELQTRTTQYKSKHFIHDQTPTTQYQYYTGNQIASIRSQKPPELAGRYIGKILKINLS